jgi:hypothetical protein
MIERIAAIDGMLFAEVIDNDYFKPERLYLYYPFGVQESHFPEKAGRGLRYLGEGRYQDENNLVWNLEHGGQTKPDPKQTRTEPIPEPKTRCQKRYTQGRWEIYRKHKGWEPA